MNPQRTCIGCRTVEDQMAMVRLVRRGESVVEATRPRLPGRGAYLHPSCLSIADQRHAIRRAFGAGALLDPAARAVIARSGS